MRILHLEDDPVDAELVRTTIVREGIDCEVHVVAAREDFAIALEKGEIDIILADFSVPGFDGMSALSMVRKRRPEIPFVFVSGTLGEEAAIETLKNGARDYVVKDRLTRLVPAVNRALSEAGDRAERQTAEEALRIAYIEIQEKAESYQNLFNSIRDVIVVSDHSRTILHVNQPALRETFGYELEEVAGKSASILYADEPGFLLIGRDVYERRKPVKGRVLELDFRRKNGELFIGELYALKHVDREGIPTGNIAIIRDISERRRAEEALHESEMLRYQLEAELVYAAKIQAGLLPRTYPELAGFQIAARCVPAKQVGGDFFDWEEIGPGVLSLTLGDVMGKGMAAAMLMATVRATIRSVSRHHRPAKVMRLAELALLPDLEGSDSFVTLFHAQLYAAGRSLTFVDCGHGYVFLLRQNSAVEGLSPRGLPLGVAVPKRYREGSIRFEKGDALVLYSDGLIDARPELALNNATLATHLEGRASAQEMVDRLICLTESEGPLPDDVTVLVVRCTE